MRLIKYYLAVLLGASLLMTGCDNKKTSRSTPGRAARGNMSQPYNVNQQYPNGNYPGGYPNGTYNGGYIPSTSQWVTIQGDVGVDFQSMIQSFVSASMDPQELGSVSPNGDVLIMSYIDMDQTGQINRANSRLQLVIQDDFARNGSAQPIVVTINSLSYAQWNGSQVNLVFQDNYGQITITGELNNYTFYGQVGFQNSTSFTGGGYGQSGTIGTFQIDRCAMFRCQ